MKLLRDRFKAGHPTGFIDAFAYFIQTWLRYYCRKRGLIEVYGLNLLKMLLEE